MTLTLLPEDLLKILLAIAVGGVIGLEREFRDKAAGFRTLIFICVGSTLFTVFSSKLAGVNDPTRIASGIVTGVGFLGAGVIMREGGRVIGLTTAAIIWLVAALGMGIGGGDYGLAIAVAGITVVVLLGFPLLERVVNVIRDERTVEVVVPNTLDKIAALEGNMRANGIRAARVRQSRVGAQLTCAWRVIGTPQAHERLTALLLSDPEILEVHV